VPMADSDVRFVFGVDLDGVCFDYYGAIKPYAAEWMTKQPEDLEGEAVYGFKPWGIDDHGGYDELHRYLLQRRFFVDGPPLPGAPDALNRLSERQIRVRISTHRLYVTGSHQAAVSQTVEWLDKNDIPYWDLCFVKDKPVVGADLYMEDTPQNVIALREAGNPTIVFANNSNVGLPGGEFPTGMRWRPS
jgi:5'(3')-deoxyribonucleotidase